MKKLYILFFVFIFLLITSFPCVHAVEVNMDIGNTINPPNVTDTSNEMVNTIDNTISNSSSTVKVSTTQTGEDFSLSASDIINIILTAVGIVLIFLAIAILLKIR